MSAARAPHRPRMRAPGYEPDPHPAGSAPPGTIRARAEPGTGGLGAGGEGGVGAGLARTPERERPARAPDESGLHARSAALVRSMLEVLTGRRPPTQLSGTAAPQVVRYLAACRSASVRAGRPGTAHAGRVHVRSPHPGAAEVVAVCRVGDRIRALALRLDHGARSGHDRTEGWTCTAVRLL